jgi:hypothetical protein
MPLQLANRVKETSLTKGSGVITLAGAVDGYQAFSSTLSSGDTTYYTITNGNNWEVGIGTYGSSTLSRDTILSSSNSDSLINLTGGRSSVFIAYPSEKSVYKDENDQVVAGSSGIILSPEVPPYVSNALYNTAGLLYFNGSQVIQSGDNVSLLVNNSGYLTDIVQDISPQLGDDLDLNFNNIIGSGNIEIEGTVSGIHGVFTSGVELYDGIPSDINNTLYNNSGNLYFNGSTVGSIKNYRDVNTDINLDFSDDVILINSTSNMVTVYMPEASGNAGKQFTIKRAYGDNVAIVNASGLGNIDGAYTFTMHHLYQSVNLISNNTNWFIT